MRKIIFNIVFNRKKVLNSKGMALLQIEAYLERRKKYFSTRIYLTPEQWDGRKKMIKNHPNAEALNRMLQEYVTSLEKEELSIWQRGRTVSLDALKESVAAKSNKDSFIAFCYKEIEHSTLKESTKKNHITTIELLESFKKEISFSDLSLEFILSFEEYMKEKKYHINTIAKHMKHIKRHLNVAISMDYIEYQKYAFRKYRIKHADHKHTYLSPEELALLEKVKLAGKDIKLQKTLDAFLFCCYTGLRYSDFMSLSSDNIVRMDQNLWLIYQSVKTKIEVRLPLYLLFQGKAIALLKRYPDVNSFFQLPNNSNVNKELDKITALAEIKKHISFHVARHTNATLLIYNGINITTVQKILGHKSVRTTQIYSSVMDMTIVKDLEMIKK